MAAPDLAVVVVDVLNHYEFEGGDDLAGSAADALPALRDLVATADAWGVPLVYVNDHHDDWRAGPEDIFRRAMAGRHPELVAPLRPPPSAAFLAKTRHSAFFGTPLATFLAEQGASRVVLCGQVTEQCVLSTALDAYVRGLDVTVARDAIAHIDAGLADAALTMMEQNMNALLTPASAALGVPR